MKEFEQIFEKWWDEYSYWGELSEAGAIKEIAKDAFWQGRKAALEWVLNHPDLIDHYQLDYVKDELNEE